MSGLGKQVTILLASFPADIEIARTLLREYAAHLNSNVETGHICLDKYEQELSALPGVYAAPRGALFLASVGGEPAGCVALKPIISRRLDENACEMKRLWVRPRFRGIRLGTLLTESLIRYAATRGYTALYLDTLPNAMQPANHVYARLGFEPVKRYYEQPSFRVKTDSTPMEVAFFRLDLVKFTAPDATL